MQIGIGTIYLLIILAKILGLIEMGWFAVITSIIWLPILVVFCALAAIGIVFGFIFGIAWLLDLFSR